MLTTQIIILAVLIILSALFSGIEIALLSMSMIKVNALVKQKKRGAEALHRLKQNPHKLIITILIGNNLVNISASAMATVLFTQLFGSSGVGIATGIMTFLILVFGEITPKTFAAQNSEKISLKVARPIEILSIILTPLVWFFSVISKLMSRILGSKEEVGLSEEELKTVVTMGAEEGILSKEAAKMMKNVLEFRGTRVVKVMTPDSEINMLDGEKKLKDVIDFIVKTPYSKYPVYGENKDKILGIIDVDDVLRCMKNKKLDVKVKTIAKKAFFVPQTKKIDSLLSDFEKKKIEVAIVVDEYGDVSGLVSIEDILEEIVGDVFENSQRENLLVKKANDKLIRLNAKISVEEINKVLHLGLKNEHFNTLAGFVESQLGKIPRKGERVRLKNVTIEVDKVSKQKIESVKIIRN